MPISKYVVRPTKSTYPSEEAAAQEVGYADAADAVGKRFTQWGREGGVGVVKDFNFESLRHEISPLTFRVSPWLNYIVLQVATEDAAGVVAEVQDKWSQLVPQSLRYE